MVQKVANKSGRSNLGGNVTNDVTDFMNCMYRNNAESMYFC